MKFSFFKALKTIYYKTLTLINFLKTSQKLIDSKIIAILRRQILSEYHLKLCIRSYIMNKIMLTLKKSKINLIFPTQVYKL